MVTPSHTNRSDFNDASERLAAFLATQLIPFVKALYKVVTTPPPKKKDDQMKVEENEEEAKIQQLQQLPWVVNETIMFRNMVDSRQYLRKSHEIMVQKILLLNNPKCTASEKLLKDRGPGLMLLIWCATGTFMDALEFDCQGEVQIIQSKYAHIKAGEIKTSVRGLSDGKAQLKRRYKIIKLCLEVIYHIREMDFEGIVYYTTSDRNAVAPQAEYINNNKFPHMTISFVKV